MSCSWGTAERDRGVPSQAPGSTVHKTQSTDFFAFTCAAQVSSMPRVLLSRLRATSREFLASMWLLRRAPPRSRTSQTWDPPASRLLGTQRSVSWTPRTRKRSPPARSECEGRRSSFWLVRMLGILQITGHTDLNNHALAVRRVGSCGVRESAASPGAYIYAMIWQFYLFWLCHCRASSCVSMCGDLSLVFHKS